MSKPTSQTELAWLRQQLADQQRQLNAVNAKLEGLGEDPTPGDTTPVNNRSRSLAQPQSPSPKVGRRRLLRGLAVGMLGGTTLALAAKPDTTQAKFVAATGTGAIVVPPGGVLTKNLPPNTLYGLVATSDSTLDLTTLPSGFHAGVIGTGEYGVAAKGSSTGLFSLGTASNSTGVYAQAGDTGVYAQGDNQGVYGQGGNRGVYGFGTNSVGIGVEGVGGNRGVSGTGGNIGVFGNGEQAGVWGITTTGFGVYGYSTHHAGQFDGTVQVNGTLIKTGGSFKIDHPLDPANQYLYHSFVESPDMLNIYNGVVTLDAKGEASVELPKWFEALNKDFRYQLTCLGSYAPVYIAQKVQNNQFKIAGGLPQQEISWQVTGIRQDAWAKAHPIPVEETKTGEEKGKYIYPELFGQPPTKAVSPKPALPPTLPQPAIPAKPSLNLPKATSRTAG